LQKIILVLSAIAISFQAHAQVKKDSINKERIHKRAFKEGLKLISTNPGDTIVNVKSVDSFEKFAGKIIRNINIEQIGFESSIYDSTKKVMNTVAKVANTIHTDTRQRTIREHLFIEPNQPLNPVQLADNERFLRDKAFILDSRIVVEPVEGTDSVDLRVITRDIFSLGATAGGSFPNAPKVSIYNANLGGLGQGIGFTMLLDQDRKPKFGYAAVFQKSSILGSLTNLEMIYTQINSGLSLGEENEYAFIARASRPLVSSYSRIAGGLEISRNWSKNSFTKPDSAFIDYGYKIVDTWIGYNIGIKKEARQRNRQFLAFRAFDYYFNERPNQPALKESLIYNNSTAYLGEFSLYRQNFYKTRYIFGFGRTEDVPYGFSMSATGGYVREVEKARLYTGFNVSYSFANKQGDFYTVNFQAGGYLYNNQIEDKVFDGGIKYNTRLLQFGKYKMRNSISTTYTHLANRVVGDWLSLSSRDIPGFSTDSLEANRRLTIHTEAVLFTPWTVFGFRFAPFTALDLATTRCATCEGRRNNFVGISAGLRTRNENLIFGTIELKMTFIPNDEYGSNQFVFGFKQNLRVKNTGSFVRAPTIIVYN
jgi:hypothetical protein